MSGKIPKTFIDHLIAQTDIVDVISQYVDIKKKGGNYGACCPFHDEKTPSFSVSPAKQFYYCFGCGAHGDAIGFIQEYNHLSFVEAVEELARQKGLDVPHEVQADSQSARQRNEYQMMYGMLEKAAQLFQWHLRQPSAKVATTYCQNRGITGKIAKVYGLGFVPAGWDNLNKALNAKGDATDLLLKVGLLTRNEKGRTYDKFRHRLMFPIRDRRGRVIGFGGRVIQSEDQPKYLNSPESPVFHKGKELYGLYEALQTTRKLKSIIVVEGYMDVIALAQAGITNAVATMGTATTLDHLRCLFKETDKVVFCFDGDKAGRQAAWRALKTALPLMTGEYEVKFLFLPAGEDPDTLVRQSGADHFNALIANALPLGELLLSALARQVDLNRADGRAKYISQVLPYLKQLPMGSMRAVMLNMLAEKSHISVAQITSQLGNPTAMSKQEHFQVNHNVALSMVEKAIHYLLCQPELIKHMTVPVWYTQQEDVLLLLALMDFLLQHTVHNAGAIIRQWPDERQAKKLAQLAAVQFDAVRVVQKQEFVDLMIKIDRALETKTLEKLLEKSKTSKLSPLEKEKITQLIQKVKIF